MKQPIAITDLTRMQEPNVCIAGYARDGRCIRPVIPFQGIGEWFLHKDDCLIIRPFAVVELDFVRHVPEAPHTEDWEIDRFHRRLVTVQLSEEKKLKLLERSASDSVSAIFGAEIRFTRPSLVKSGTIVSSSRIRQRRPIAWPSPTWPIGTTSTMVESSSVTL
jgi:hypothetical protein